MYVADGLAITRYAFICGSIACTAIGWDCAGPGAAADPAAPEA